MFNHRRTRTLPNGPSLMVHCRIDDVSECRIDAYGPESLLPAAASNIRYNIIINLLLSIPLENLMYNM